MSTLGPARRVGVQRSTSGLLSTKILLSTVILVGLAGPAAAISRDQVMARAKAFAYHPWRCTTANLTASCSSTYKSAYIPGDYLGLPYDWGGYMTLFQFDQEIGKGYGAGSYSSDGVLSCTSGLDCSGYVSKCWDAGHYTTSNLSQISSVIPASSLLPGDAFNQAGYHVILFSHKLGNGEPVLYEAAGYNVHINVSGGWSYVSGYTPRRYNNITGTTVGNPAGTTTNPIVIGSLPYNDSRDTTGSSSDVLDGCAAEVGKDESGYEYIYKVTFSTPGTVTVSVSDGPTVDIDVHLYTAMNTNNCVARADSTFSYGVDCGTYYIVADTFRGSAGTEYPGPYTLNVSFTPSSAGCGSGPAGYQPKGKLGDACAYPGNKNLPFCNENLGAEVCLYTSTSSFCSKPCKTGADCSSLAGACCKAAGSSGTLYCLPATWCGATPDGGLKVPDAWIPAGDGRPRDSRPRDGGRRDKGPVPESGLPPGDGAGPGGEPGVSDGDAGCGCVVARRTENAGASLLLLVLGLALGWLRRGKRWP